MILTSLRVRNINYIVINKDNVEKYIGNVNDYNIVLKEASLVKEKDVLINKLMDKVKNEEVDKIKEILEILERK